MQEDDWERRSYVKDGVITMSSASPSSSSSSASSSSSTSNRSDYYFILFNDCIMYTKKSGLSFFNKTNEKLKFCGKFDIRKIEIADGEDTEGKRTFFIQQR